MRQGGGKVFLDECRKSSSVLVPISVCGLDDADGTSLINDHRSTRLLQDQGSPPRMTVLVPSLPLRTGCSPNRASRCISRESLAMPDAQPFPPARRTRRSAFSLSVLRSLRVFARKTGAPAGGVPPGKVDGAGPGWRRDMALLGAITPYPCGSRRFCGGRSSMPGHGQEEES